MFLISRFSFSATCFSIPIAVLPLFVMVAGCGTPAGSAPTGNARLSFAEAVQKAGGDYNKMTPEEKKMADDASRGHGAKFVKNTYDAKHQ